MKKILFFLLFAGAAHAQIVSRIHGGTAPWLSGDANKYLKSNGISAPTWEAGGSSGGGDTSCVIYGGWNTAFDGGYVGLSFAYGSGGYPTFADSIVGNKAQPTLMNTAGKLSHLVIREAKTLDSTGCSCGNSADTFQLYKNGSPTAIQVVIPLGSRTGVDSVNSVTVAQGDLMQYHETSGSLGASPMAFSILNNISASNGNSGMAWGVVAYDTVLDGGTTLTGLIVASPSGTLCTTFLSQTHGATLIPEGPYGSTPFPDTPKYFIIGITNGIKDSTWFTDFANSPSGADTGSASITGDAGAYDSIISIRVFGSTEDSTSFVSGNYISLGQSLSSDPFLLSLHKYGKATGFPSSQIATAPALGRGLHYSLTALPSTPFPVKYYFTKQ